MIINHPLLGPRDAAEFTILGDAIAMMRPDTSAPGKPDQALLDAFHDYIHLRENPAGVHHELWYHEQGDRSWLVVTRDTISHDVISVVLASDFKRRNK
jgi:sarcosine oxidase subunit delta